MEDILEKLFNDYNIDCKDTGELIKYQQILLAWNQKINLTAIVEPKEIAIKHFLDSLLVFKAIDIKPNSKIIDIGTGAGFPGVVLKIARKDIQLTLLDSLNKRLVFLSELGKELNLEYEIVHERAEIAANQQKHREQYDVVTSRAVSKLNVLSEYCIPYLKKGGLFVAMKGPNLDDEIQEANKAIKTLGGKLDDIKEFTLPDGSNRNIVVIKKIKNTEKKYPRNTAQIKKNPL